MPDFFLLLLVPCLAFASPSSSSSSSPIPSDAKALLLAVTDNWNSTQTQLQLYRRTLPNGSWSLSGSPKQVHLGRSGLAWGRGLHPNQPGPQKREGDKKSPAGVFPLGSILYGYADRLSFPGWRYRRVSDRDLWIEDPTSLNYNRHLILPPHMALPTNHLYDLMRQDDPAHALKLFIRHNAPPDVVPAAGSAIFFHLCRGQDSTTTGCTSLEEPDFHALLNSFSPSDHPVYVLLPRIDYDRLRSTWKLP